MINDGGGGGRRVFLLCSTERHLTFTTEGYKFDSVGFFRAPCLVNWIDWDPSYKQPGAGKIFLSLSSFLCSSNI